MNYIISATRPQPLFTLQDLTVIKLITMLSNNQQLLNLILNFRGDLQSRLYIKMTTEWEAVQLLAKELLSRVWQSKILNDMIMELLWPMSYKIILWKYTYAPSIAKEFLRCFYWTARGEINTIKTARCIIGNRNVPTKQRYTLACRLALRRDIKTIWKEEVSKVKPHAFFNKDDDVLELLVYWAHVIKGKIKAKYKRLHIDEAQCAMDNGLVEVIKYLIDIDASDEIRNDMASLCFDLFRDKVQSNCLLEENEKRIGYFLFSKMSRENQVNVFNEHSVLTMSLLLHSSNREVFMGELKRRLPDIPRSCIQELLYTIFYNYHLEIKSDCDYQELFVHVWRMVPEPIKCHIKENTNMGTDFLRILIKGDYQHLVLFSGTSLPDQISITADRFNTDRWEFLHFLLEEGIVANPPMAECREVFSNFVKRTKNRKVFCEKV